MAEKLFSTLEKTVNKVQTVKIKSLAPSSRYKKVKLKKLIFTKF